METVCLSTARSSPATMRLHRLRSVLESSVAWRLLLVTVLLCGLPRPVTGYFDLFLNHSEMIKLMVAGDVGTLLLSDAANELKRPVFNGSERQESTLSWSARVTERVSLGLGKPILNHQHLKHPFTENRCMT
ncbi:hypothetical protein ZHAS_00003627 [Anopheles sinensis]|uniref:Uncharacterized protein n=1 Tax=Anopheles sinensis TaxID=74873 RepID=A0A084VEV2_ANOSI|nr:hypothetical protein ZHAS_00003627 [Anopheles sinensis]